jgi:long-chain acyl-CoA synthetase
MESRPWLKTYDPQVPHTVEPYPKIPLFGFLEQAARDYPSSTALIFKPRAMKGALDGLTSGKMTYRTLNELTDRLAGALAKLGVKKGDRVVIFMPNSPQFVIAYYGILKAGGCRATNLLYARAMENQFNDARRANLATSTLRARQRGATQDQGSKMPSRTSASMGVSRRSSTQARAAEHKADSWRAM